MTDTKPDSLGPAVAFGHQYLLYFIALTILTFDQITKFVVEATVPLYTSWAPWPSLARFFQITHSSNTGAAFGLFENGNTLFAIAAIIVTVVIAYYNRRLPANQLLLRAALGCQLGGALGNFFDRVRLGHVTDFLDFGPWYIFNVADTAVVTGLLLLLWLMVQEERQARRAPASEPLTTSVETGPST